MMMNIEVNQKNRDFICPCQKSYFSYAALFTHIKQKHNGKAPGQITKPKPQNKRGRPRKCTTSLQSSSSCTLAIIKEQSNNIPNGNINLNNSNSFHIINNNDYLFKISPGSQFKQYKVDNQNISTTYQLPEEINYQITLLEDLANNLFCIRPYDINQDIFNQIEAYQLLKVQNRKNKSKLIKCFQGFIEFVKQGLANQIASQIQLLIVLLLQHVYQCNDKSSLQSLSHIQLNEYIDSFFMKLESYTHRFGIDKIIIFKNLNPMKILVVLYNWINTIDNPLQSQFQQQDK